MSFIDVPTTSRKRMTRTRALRLWERHKAVCVTCNLKIDGARDDWFIEHIRALELGGPDTDDNCGPAHLSCKREKDASDHRKAAKAKRRKASVLGIRLSRTPLPCGRASKWRKKMNGEVVLR